MGVQGVVGVGVHGVYLNICMVNRVCQFCIINKS